MAVDLLNEALNRRGRRRDEPRSVEQQAEDALEQHDGHDEVDGSHDETLADGPRIEPGPLEIARQREAQGPTPRPRPQGNLVERNADGVAVVTAGFGDERPI